MAKKPLIGKRRIKEIAVRLEEWRGRQADSKGPGGYTAYTDELRVAADELGIDSTEMLHFHNATHPQWPPKGAATD